MFYVPVSLRNGILLRSGNVGEFRAVVFIALHVIILNQVLDAGLDLLRLRLEVLDGGHYFLNQVVEHHRLVGLHLFYAMSFNNLVALLHHTVHNEFLSLLGLNFLFFLAHRRQHHHSDVVVLEIRVN